MSETVGIEAISAWTMERPRQCRLRAGAKFRRAARKGVRIKVDRLGADVVKAGGAVVGRETSLAAASPTRSRNEA
jgi:hypothetical protein